MSLVEQVSLRLGPNPGKVVQESQRKRALISLAFSLVVTVGGGASLKASYLTSSFLEPKGSPSMKYSPNQAIISLSARRLKTKGLFLGHC